MNPLPTPHMAAGALAGIRVVERPDLLRYDEIYVAQDGPYVVVGERAHFEYRLYELDMNKQLRQWFRLHVAAEARRILGEEVT